MMGMVDMEIDKMAAEVVAMGVDVVDMKVDNADEQVAGMVVFADYWVQRRSATYW